LVDTDDEVIILDPSYDYMKLQFFYVNQARSYCA
jgi:hypothetical protein